MLDVKMVEPLLTGWVVVLAQGINDIGCAAWAAGAAANTITDSSHARRDVVRLAAGRWTCNCAIVVSATKLQGREGS